MIPQRILIATDGSPSAKAAEELGADLAILMSYSRSVEVVVLSATHDAGPLTPAGGMMPSSLTAKEAEQAVAEGADHVRGIVAGSPKADVISIQAKVIQSLTPGGGILAEAHATGTCSVIIIGNRGHGRLTEALLGSVSQYVVRETHCPVMIART